MSRPSLGTERLARYRVTPAMSPPHLRPATVLGSSALVELIELTALESVAPALAPGETTVGTLIRLEHRRPAFVGEEVEIRSRLTVAGRRLAFEIDAAVGERVVGRAIHERAVVDRARFGRRQA